MEFIGIEVHKRESQVCILAAEGEVVERRIRTERMRFAELLGGGLMHWARREWWCQACEWVAPVAGPQVDLASGKTCTCGTCEQDVLSRLPVQPKLSESF